MQRTATHASFLDEKPSSAQGATVARRIATIDSAPTPPNWPPPLALCNVPAWAAASESMSIPAQRLIRYLVHFTQSGIGLPDEQLTTDEQHAAVLAAHSASPGCSAWCTGAVTMPKPR